MKQGQNKDIFFNDNTTLLKLHQNDIHTKVNRNTNLQLFMHEAGIMVALITQAP